MTTVAGVHVGDAAEQDSVSSDSGRGPSEEEYRANSLQQQQQQQLHHYRPHNGEIAAAHQ